MIRNIAVGLLSIVLMGMASMVEAQSADALVIFDEAKLIDGGLPGVLEKVAKVNGKRLYPGDTLSVKNDTINFEVRVKYIDQMANVGQSISIDDNMSSFHEFKVSSMKYGDEVVTVDHSVVSQPKDAFDTGIVDHWKFIFVVYR